MKLLILFATTLLSFSALAGLKSMLELKSPFVLAPLPYSANSLEPFLDKETMTIHHDLHHKAYVTTLNENLKETGVTLSEIFRTMANRPDVIRNNAGGHWNHSFFWEILSKDKANNTLPDDLKKDLEKKFGSVEKFKEAFEAKGKGQFGSGWVWLIRNLQGELEIVSTPNQDNPLMSSAPTKGFPLLGADVWEHAYYLTYKNERPKYLKAFWSVVNWKKVAEFYQESKDLKLAE